MGSPIDSPRSPMSISPPPQSSGTGEVVHISTEGLHLATVSQKTGIYASEGPERKQAVPEVPITSMKPLTPSANYAIALGSLPRACQEGKLDEKMAAPLVTKLRDYTATLPGDDTKAKKVKSCMEAFVKDHLEQLPPGTKSIEVRCLPGGGAMGKSGAPVFEVFDQDGKRIAIAKGFPSSEELAQEMRAQSTLQGLSLQQSTTPQGLGVGKCKVENTFYFLMLQTVAPGKSIASHLEAVRSAPDRTQAMQTAKAAVQYTARAMAELHSKAPREKAAPSVCKLMTDDMNTSFRKIKLNKSSWPNTPAFNTLRQLTTIQKPALNDELTTFVNKTNEGFMANPGHGAISHGDSHPGNFFYDDGSRTFSMIDLPTCSRSYDGKTGLMSPAWDCQLFKFKLAESMVNVDKNPSEPGLTLQEVQELEKAFDEAYAEAGGKALTPEAAQFGKLDRVLTSLAQYTETLKSVVSNESIERTVILQMIDYRVSMLNEMIQKSKASS